MIRRSGRILSESLLTCHRNSRLTHQQKYLLSVGRANFTASKEKPKNKFKHTVNLLSTKFPRNPVGVKRRIIEKEIYENGKFASLYQDQKQKTGKQYILHDGPPYANGQLHMGHALNKILKDITIRYQVIRGNEVHYVPGWDCHGLPIELKAMEEMLKSSKSNETWEKLSPKELRSRARRLSEKAMGIQKKSFAEWGVMADWEDIYVTTSPKYIAKELQLFGELYEKGYIFQSYLPVHFSPSSKSSLAESELEYNDKHESPSLYLALPIDRKSKTQLSKQVPAIQSGPLYFCIWTTTPWTLPANTAVCISEQSDYAIVETIQNGKPIYYVWSLELLKTMKEVLGNAYKIVAKIKGDSLLGLQYHNPINKKLCPVWNSSHVKMTKGTGVVHTAPAHGKEDFFAAMQNSMFVTEQLVGEDGRYTVDAGTDLHGKLIVEEGNDAVLHIIQNSQPSEDSAVVLSLGKLIHSYPYDWRTKKPTIVRASRQWFFDIEKVKQMALEALDDVTFLPSRFEKNFREQIGSRPYWCLSRQRVWGVPIPAFYDPHVDKPVINGRIIAHLTELFTKEGVDVWWEYPTEKLLPPEYVQELKEQGKPLPLKGDDILDIWFDSGASNHCVLDDVPADMCIEGVDQTNGWFQSSLLIGVAANHRSPFKKLLMHGFAVDENNEKMSKSRGNVVNPIQLTDGNPKQKSSVYGVNILRMWVAQFPVTKDIPMGQESLRRCENDLIALRSAFWFIVAAIKNVNHSTLVGVDDLRLQDKAILHLVKNQVERIWKHYDDVAYDEALKSSYDLIVSNIGQDYLNSIKEILLCEKEGPQLASVLTTLHLILPQLLRVVAPIVPHLSEEVASYVPTDGISVFRDYTSDPPATWSMQSMSDIFGKLTKIRDEVQSKIRQPVDDSNSKSSLIKQKILIKYGPQYAEVLQMVQNEPQSHNSDICAYLGVSEVNLQFSEDFVDTFSTELTESELTACLRCFKYAATMEAELCLRCENIVNTEMNS